LIVVLAGIGFATAFLGLVVAIPILGHATWHAYRAMIPPQKARAGPADAGNRRPDPPVQRSQRPA
jgi:uncharacterized membrane protein